MPDSPAAKRARAKSDYERNSAEKKFKAIIRNIVSGRKPTRETRIKYELGEREINKIRGLDNRYRAILEHKHGLDLKSIYEGKTPLPPIDLPNVQVREVPAEAPRPEGYKQCLEETPSKGLNFPITWEQIDTFWSGDVSKHEMGSSRVRKTLQDNQLVDEKYAKKTRDDVRRTFRQIRTEMVKQDLDDNAIPTLRKAKEVMAWFRKRNTKTAVQVEADATQQDSSVGAVAGRDDSDDEEVTSGPATSVAGKRSRARTKSVALKGVTQSYSKKLGHITTTFEAWKAFRDSLGTDVLQEYRGTFGEGEVGLMQAIQADKETQGNKPRSALHAVPSYEMLQRYLPRIKSAIGPNTKWLAAFLQTKLLGLRDNLGGIEILRSDGRRYDPSVGDSSRFDWYNRNSGKIYIAHFKTGKSRFGSPYEFDISKHPEIKRAIDETLAPGHPEANRKWLVGVGVNKTGLPSPAGPRVKAAFKAAGLNFAQLNQGKLIDTSVTPLDVRHAQVTWKHKELSRKNPNLTATQISEKIAGFFNHASDVNIGYLRKTFDSVNSPLATKKGLTEEAQEEERLAERRASNAKASTKAPDKPVSGSRVKSKAPASRAVPDPKKPPARSRTKTSRAIESEKQASARRRQPRIRSGR